MTFGQQPQGNNANGFNGQPYGQNQYNPNQNSYGQYSQNPYGQNQYQYAPQNMYAQGAPAARRHTPMSVPNMLPSPVPTVR